MNKEPGARPGGPETRQVRGVAGSFLVSYVSAAFLIGTVVYFGGIWNVIANTRLLDPLMNIGIVKHHDADMGVVQGVPEPEVYLRSQDPVDWRLVVIAFALYFMQSWLKAIQFHGIGSWLGMKGNFGQHARAYLYGDGLNRLFPHGFGDCAMICTVEAQGDDPNKARGVFRVMELLVILFEILLFTAYGLIWANWNLFFWQNFIAVLFLVVMIYIFRERQRGWWAATGRTYRALANDPKFFAKQGVISALSMLMDDIAPFVMAMAFSAGNRVILFVPFVVVQAAVSSCYIAKHIQLTPNGIGQYEITMMFVLYASGLGMPEAATIALLDMFVRMSSAMILLFIVGVWGNIETNLRTVYAVFTGAAANVREALALREQRGAAAPIVAVGGAMALSHSMEDPQP